ncbi:capsular exopolysaccharide synthesis family protein [Enteractinococcus coprophilus]|uniref:non-specific protein-tyrosine kinase n=1 Tax=Enteractinococcus coprophilus TaxID=1027633 RepID=A0A543AMM4_9MICC|nr:polysaccharide biosynthesis tyrosine autokinase [Enteractinococcus coprophilus]TQL73843.1 capsular exopolysaccharide synthesis family protein [Enteractinococcus coprophilus]
MELGDYLRILYTHWVLIVVTTILGTGAGFVVTQLTTPIYEAEAKLYVSVRTDSQASSDLLQGSNFARQSMATFVELATTKSVLVPLAEELNLDVSPRQLADQITVSAPADSTLINISVLDENPMRAVAIANEVGVQTRTLVEEELEPPHDDDATSPVQITVVQPATEPTAPVSPRPQTNLVLGCMLGMAVGVGIALLRTVLDTRIRTTDDIEQISAAPILGRIAHDSKAAKKPLIVHLDPKSPRAESFRTLRTNVQFLAVGEGPKTFVISSAGPGEGKSTTAANLALALAETGMKLALVDCDLRRPRVAEYMGVEGSVGLTDVLIGRVEAADVMQRWGQTQLYVLPAGQIPPNPSELLGSSMMDQLLAQLEQQVDMVILDAPPVLLVTDAVVVGAKTQGMIFVAAAGITKKRALEGAITSLDTAHVPLRGIIATMLPAKGASLNGYGAYAYAYGEENRTAPRRSWFRKLLPRQKAGTRRKG